MPPFIFNEADEENQTVLGSSLVELSYSCRACGIVIFDKNRQRVWFSLQEAMRTIYKRCFSARADERWRRSVPKNNDFTSLDPPSDSANKTTFAYGNNLLKKMNTLKISKLPCNFLVYLDGALVMRRYLTFEICSFATFTIMSEPQQVPRNTMHSSERFFLVSEI